MLRCEKGRNYHKTFASKVSRVCLLFLRWGGTIECTVNWKESIWFMALKTSVVLTLKKI